MNESSSTERLVSIGGLHDRRDRLRQHRHHRPEEALELYSWPLASSTIGWKWTSWLFFRLKK